jgi:hypothetical protein
MSGGTPSFAGSAKREIRTCSPSARAPYHCSVVYKNIDSPLIVPTRILPAAVAQPRGSTHPFSHHQRALAKMVQPMNRVCLVGERQNPDLADM